MKTEILQIDGMSCGHCVHAVKQALSNTSGVMVESVEIGSARISYDPREVSEATIREAVAEEGYQVTNALEA